jgi:uroporphyrinogen decarboxylase
LEEEVKDLYEHSPYAIMLGGFSESFFGLPSWLIGHERFYRDLVTNESFVQAVLDHLEDFFLHLAEEALNRVGHLIQIVKVSDDLGMQSGPILSPDLYRKLIKPRQKSLYAYIKERTDAKLFLHSCGSVYAFIEDFIDNGVDILNPVQVSAVDMQPERLKQEFGDRLAFWGGGCDTQRVLPFGTEEEIEKEVKTRIGQLAPGGGFVFSAVHNIQYDVPPENVVAMYDAARRYGAY